MSCYNCAVKFSWRKKDLECPNCRKSVCKSCLASKIVLSKFAPKESLVCTKCFNNLSKLTHGIGTTQDSSATTPGGGKQGQPPAYDEPSTYFGPSMRDLACSSRKPQSTTEISKLDVPITRAATEISIEDPDAKIAERLKQLKGNEDAVATSADVESRFLKVTGQQAATNTSNINTPQMKLTEAEEVMKLLEQTKEEVNIDEKYNDDGASHGRSNAENLLQIEERLLRLKGIDPKDVKANKSQGYDSSSEDESEATEKLIQKAMTELRLEEQMEDAGYGYLISPTNQDTLYPQVPESNPGEATSSLNLYSSQGEEEEELPWCCICNADATVRCHGCDDDLYCNRCFKEGHDKYDVHSKSPYKAKAKR